MVVRLLGGAQKRSTDMTHRSDLEVLVELIDENLTEADGVLLRGADATGDHPDADRRRAVLDRLRDDPDARLTLFLFALEARRGSVGSGSELADELGAFADRMAERFDVDLLGTVAQHREQLPELPPGLLSGTDDAGSRQPYA